jgi:hypothetical protein
LDSPEQIRLSLIAALIELGSICSQLRMGQMLANLASMAGRMDPEGVWDLEDEEALEAARTFIRELQERGHQAPN